MDHAVRVSRATFEGAATAGRQSRCAALAACTGRASLLQPLSHGVPI
jgi:hypothetical protein